jgi:hypothetical protein
MKLVYTLIVTVSLPFLFLFTTSQTSYAQTCPDGSPQGGTAFDTTISFESGVTSTEVKFPKFNPLNGMVTCVRLCITITGVVDTVALQNLSASGQTATFTYDRTDQITGPGIITPLSNTITQPYGPYALTPYDGVPGAGTDFVSISHDTVLNSVLCRNINDSATIAQFYGLDSVIYDYDINVSTLAAFSGGNSSNFILTSALVNFRFEYCTCPPVVLPLNVNSFNVNKLTNTRVELKWTGLDDPYANYHYEAEVSRDGRKFSSIGLFDKSVENRDYHMLYTTPNGVSGTFYFRVKQVYSNGYVRYSNIKHVIMENSGSPKFSVFPNPSTGIVGIKFDNSLAGRFEIQIYNSQGQLIVNKDVVVGGSSYVQIGVLGGGQYWLRLTDKQSHVSCVNQLIIK